MELETILILLSFCVNFNTGYLLESSSLISNGQRGLAGRSGGWGWSGDSGITSFLEKIAALLTFLSFGVFLLNLLLNALLFGSTLLGLLPTATYTGTSTATGTPTATGTGTGGTATTSAPAPTTAPVLITASGGGSGGIGITNGGLTITGSGSGAGGLGINGRKRTEQRRRGKRSTFQLKIKPIEVANVMAKELIEMIEAVISVNEECLPNILCVTNRRASFVENGFQYLMPLCSMGVSYFGEKFGLKGNMSSYISAIYDGIEEQNCSIKHPRCNLK